MKIAICLSGQFRRFVHCWPSIIKHVAQGHECDFFIHTWNTITDNDPRMVQYAIPRFKLYSVQDQINFDLSQYNGRRFNTVSMFYSIKMANILKQFSELHQGFKYDFVVRCRTDLEFLADIPYETTKLTTADFGDHFLGDQFAYGPSEAMDIYSSCFDFLKHPEVISQELRPEETLGAYIYTVAKLPVNLFQAQYRILR